MNHLSPIESNNNNIPITSWFLNSPSGGCADNSMEEYWAKMKEGEGDVENGGLDDDQDDIDENNAQESERENSYTGEHINDQYSDGSYGYGSDFNSADAGGNDDDDDDALSANYEDLKKEFELVGEREVSGTDSTRSDDELQWKSGNSRDQDADDTNFLANYISSPVKRYSRKNDGNISDTDGHNNYDDGDDDDDDDGIDAGFEIEESETDNSNQKDDEEDDDDEDLNQKQESSRYEERGVVRNISRKVLGQGMVRRKADDGVKAEKASARKEQGVDSKSRVPKKKKEEKKKKKGRPKDSRGSYDAELKNKVLVRIVFPLTNTIMHCIMQSRESLF
jgi:hypothetical protein